LFIAASIKRPDRTRVSHPAILSGLSFCQWLALRWVSTGHYSTPGAALQR
jgi:hypothetical protein